MELGELLSELRENILHDRSDRILGSSDYLWTDATLVRYIDEAQRQLARRALVLRDGTTPEVTQVTLVESQTHYTLHESVLGVISARVDDDSYDLSRLDHTILQGTPPPDMAYFDVNQIALQNPGKPRGFATDDYFAANDTGSSGVVTLRVYPAPSADYAGSTINLRVVRLPLERLDVNDECQVPEVPEEYHLQMLDHAAYLALRIVDLDAGSPERAMLFQQTFEAVIAQARREVLRKLRPQAKWHFGRAGFTWEH